MAHLKTHLTHLQSALAESQSLQDRLDLLLRWLDEAERNVHKMDKGSIIVAKKEPLLESIEEHMVRGFILT